MKRVLAAAITGTMIFAVGMQAGAAPSVTGGGAQQGNIPAEQVVETNAEQKKVGDLDYFLTEPLEEGTVTWGKIDSENYTEEEMTVINQLNDAIAETSVKDAFGELVDLTEMKLFALNGDEVDLEVEEIDLDQLLEELRFLSPVWELSFNGIEPTKENPVLCTFTVNNLTEDMEVYMLYECEEDGWELLTAEKAADNQVKVLVHGGTAPSALVYQLPEDVVDAAVGTSPVAEIETEVVE